MPACPRRAQSFKRKGSSSETPPHFLSGKVREMGLQGNSVTSCPLGQRSSQSFMLGVTSVGV